LFENEQSFRTTGETSPMIAAQVAGRSEGARAPEILFRGCAVAMLSLPDVVAIATIFFLTKLRVHW